MANGLLGPISAAAPLVEQAQMEEIRQGQYFFFTKIAIYQNNLSLKFERFKWLCIVL
jgi:hypothetical protein